MIDAHSTSLTKNKFNQNKFEGASSIEHGIAIPGLKCQRGTLGGTNPRVP